MIGRFGPMELVIILAIALLIFGPKKLPEIGKALGKTITEFKAHTNKISSTEDDTSSEQAKKLSTDETQNSDTGEQAAAENSDEEPRSS